MSLLHTMLDAAPGGTELTGAVLSGTTISAHGVGGGKDLPIPPELAIAGGVAALVISFTVLATAWRSPRYDGRERGTAVPALQRVVDHPVTVFALRLLGLLLFGYALWAAVAGQDLLTNPFFGMFMVLLWVGLVPLSLVFGRAWRAINPARTLSLLLARVTGSDPETGILSLSPRLGLWPAALGLYAFVWFELVYPHSTELASARLWMVVWLVVLVMGGALFGTRWISSADPFEVYSDLVAKVSPWGRDAQGRLVLRSPLANLSTLRAQPGLTAVVAVLFGSTGFDSFRESTVWVQYIQSTTTSSNLLNNLALLGFVVGVGALFALGTMTTGVEPGTSRRALPNLFAASVVPIIVGYMVAHYLTYFVEFGQQTLIYMSDPLSRGDNLLGTGAMSVNYWLSEHPTLLATTKVLAVVLGHVVGVVAAHDRAVALLPKRHQLTGQLPLLLVMVLFTGGGLYLLFAA